MNKLSITTAFGFFSLFLQIDAAHAIFGQEDVSLDEYYQFGKSQTGVAAVNAVRPLGVSLGTANLVDIGVKSLEGRLMITAAHVIDGPSAERCSVRFMDEDNNFQSVAVQALFLQTEYKTTGQDIGFIVLKKAVDTNRFKPLQLNLSQNNDSLVGKEISIFGCTDTFGKANTNIVINEGIHSSLRRGMKTIIRSSSDSTPRIACTFRHHDNAIKLQRNEERILNKEDELKKTQIVEKLSKLPPLINKAIAEGDTNSEKKIKEKRFNLSMERDFFTPSVILRPELSKTIRTNESLEKALNSIEDTGDLDKSKLMKEYNNVLGDKRTAYKSLEMKPYSVSLWKPLPRLSGITYHGDSGGACIIDDEIVALTMAGYHDNYNNLKEVQIEPSKTIAEHFIQAEKTFESQESSARLLKNEKDHPFFQTSVWSCRDWIESTLAEITQASKGAVRIYRPREAYKMTEGEAKKREADLENEIAELRRRLDAAKKENDMETISKLKVPYTTLMIEQMYGKDEVETRWAFGQTLQCDESLESRLGQLEDTDDLDKKVLMEAWDQFIESNESESKVSIANYDFTFYSYYHP